MVSDKLAQSLRLLERDLLNKLQYVNDQKKRDLQVSTEMPKLEPTLVVKDVLTNKEAFENAERPQNNESHQTGFFNRFRKFFNQMLND